MEDHDIDTGSVQSEFRAQGTELLKRLSEKFLLMSFAALFVGMSLRMLSWVLLLSRRMTRRERFSASLTSFPHPLKCHPCGTPHSRHPRGAS